MIVRIKTHHGYLSPQPVMKEHDPVVFQYRESPGLWEDIDIEGLEALIPPAPTPTPPSPEPTPPPVSGIPAAVQPVEQSAAYVGRVKSYLLSQGHNLSGACGAFDIVKHATWYLYLVGSYGVGLLSKPDGNQCEGYATDIVMYSTMNGQIIDILGDGGGQNNPQWGVSDVVDPARWRPPVQPA